jgi:zinc-finger of transposase IS204/IS1001/IS1096/IS1165
VKEHGTALPAGGGTTDTATAAFGLPGFVVAAAGEYAGELELLVETTESVTGCPRCGMLATLHDRKPRSVRDLPSGGRPVMLVWFKRIWRCAEPLCRQRTWSESSAAIRPQAVLTERARAECARRVGQDATDVARPAAIVGGCGPAGRSSWSARWSWAARPAL